MQPSLTPDLMGDPQWARLEAVATVLDRRPLEDFGEPRADALLARAHVLLTGWGCPHLSADVVRRTPNLKLVAHSGSSVRPIISEAVWSRGIAVISAAAANAIPVAEYALAAILFANKSVFRAREDYRARRRPRSYPWVAPREKGNLGGIVGIVGASRTGRRLLGLLRAFDLEVLVYDPVASADDIERLGARLVALEDLVDVADVLSVHAPSLPQTRGMIDAGLLARLRDGATVINTARGEIIEQGALERELVSGRLNAVLDVTQPEPSPASSILFALPNVFLTPHLAGAAGFETRRLADLAIDEIARFSAGAELRHRLTPEMLETLG